MAVDKTIGSIDPSVYTDFKALGELKSLAAKDQQAALKEVAQQFEQVFMNMMLKTMRQANESFAEDNPFNSSEVEMFQSMLDQQLTLELSRGEGMGLADIIVRQLGGAPSSGLSDSEQAGNLDNDTLRALVLDMTSRRVASQSWEVVDEISEQVEAGGATAATNDSTLSEENNGSVSKTFTGPADFVETLLPMAERAAEALGVDPRVLVAQAALETGWGRSIIAAGDGSSNNLFNIKADSRWSGERVGVQTLEYRDGLLQPERAEFRAYDSLEDSFDDYVEFIQTNPRYEQAMQQADDPLAYLQELQRAGYATDPEYARKIGRILGGMTLARGGDAPQEG